MVVSAMSRASAGVALVELGLDLAEDSLLVLGKRHLPPLLSVGPGRSASIVGRRADGSGIPVSSFHSMPASTTRVAISTARTILGHASPTAVTRRTRARSARCGPPGPPGGARPGPTAARPAAGRAAHPGRRGSPGRWRRRRSGPGWRRRPGWRRPTRPAPTSSRLSWRVPPSASPLTLTPMQPDPGRRVDAGQQGLGLPRDRPRVESVAPASVVERVMVRKSRKRTLSVTVRPARPWRPQAAPRPRRPAAPARARGCRGVWWSLGEGLLVADRLDGGGRAPRPGRRCRWPGACRCGPAALPSERGQHLDRRGGQVADGRHPQPFEPLQRGRADAPQRLDRQRVQEAEHLVRSRRP